MSIKARRALANTFIYAFLLFIFVLIMFPLVYVIASSFKTNSEILAHPEYIFPRVPTFENYILAWNSPDFTVSRMFCYSVYYSLVSTTITLITSSMCGYVFERGHFRGKKLILGTFTALLFVNLGMITMYPTFEVVDFLGIDKSIHTQLILKILSIPVFNFYLVMGYVRTIPKEIDEAARIDGCSFFRIYRSMIIPLITPILATIGILGFNGSWNEYLGPMIWTMGHPEQRTLIVGVVSLKSSGEAASSWNLMLAGTTIALIPVLVAYAFGSKFFIEGIAAGAVKG